MRRKLTAEERLRKLIRSEISKNLNEAGTSYIGPWGAKVFIDTEGDGALVIKKNGKVIILDMDEIIDLIEFLKKNNY